MIGSDLEGADLESRVASWAALPARGNQRASGSCSFWNAWGPLEDHAAHVPADAGAVGGDCSDILRVRHLDSGTFRIRLRSPSTMRRRGHPDLPARTGAVQVDVGVAGAVRVPALGAVGAASGHGSRPTMH
jgi:hypothetical protein